VAIAFFSGLQMAMIGLVGEYLFLALKEARKAPRYVVAQSLNFQKSSVEGTCDLASTALSHGYALPPQLSLKS